MPVEIKIDVSGIDDFAVRLNNLSEQIADGYFLDKIAMNQIARMKLRTAAGVDFKGEGFTPYAPSYADFRRKRGRRTDIVDLFFSGKMLASMTYEKKGKDEVRFIFADPAQGAKAFAHQTGTGGVPKREFFSISDDDLQAMVVEIEEEIKREYGDLQ